MVAMEVLVVPEPILVVAQMDLVEQEQQVVHLQ